jgi:hypothetical protein
LRSRKSAILLPEKICRCFATRLPAQYVKIGGAKISTGLGENLSTDAENRGQIMAQH